MIQGLQVHGIGTVVADPEMRYGTTSGDAYVNFTVATNRGHYEGEGADQKWVTDDSTFIKCVAFKKRAEAIAQLLKKGTRVFVQGEIRTDRWEDKETKAPRSMHKLFVDAFEKIRDSKPVAELSGADKAEAEAVEAGKA